MKKLLLLAMVLVLLTGCYATSLEERRKKSYWIKDGKEVATEQLQKDYQECRGSIWVKDGSTIEEAKKDYDFCMKAGLAREKHTSNISSALSVGQIVTLGVPIISIALGVASMSIPSGRDYFQRCIESKGYKHTEQKDMVDQCMQEKGYEWIEEK